MGGSLLTSVSQHKLSLPSDVVAIGDFNSSLRMFEIPPVFRHALPDERQQLVVYVQREVARKAALERWQAQYYESNAPVRAARLQCAQEAAAEHERLEKLARERDEIAQKRAEAEERQQRNREHSRNIFDMPERLERKWDAMNIRRLMRILMAKKNVNPVQLAKWSVPEKRRQVYDAKKRSAIEESFRMAAVDMASLRATLLPVDVPEEDRMSDVIHNLSPITQVGAADEALHYEQVQTKSLNAVRFVGSSEQHVVDSGDILIVYSVCSSGTSSTKGRNRHCCIFRIYCCVVDSAVKN